MKKIRIRSGKSSEFNTDFTVKGISYHVQTDEGSEKNPFIITTAYMGGIVVDQEKVPYPIKDRVDKKELKGLMKKNHDHMILKMKKKHLESTKSKAAYLKEVRKLVKRRKLKNALELIEDAIVLYPEEPFIKSFHGYLIAAVLKKHKEGIEMCKNALTTYDKKGLVGGEYYHHFFYLNLGRAYIVARNKDYAVRYLRKGLDYDVNNKEIINELILLGVRKRLPIPFLSRGNFLNKYIGLILYRLGLRK